MSVKTSCSPPQLPHRMRVLSQSSVSMQTPLSSPSRKSSNLTRRSPWLLNNHSRSHAKLKRLSGKSARRRKNCRLIKLWNASSSSRRRESTSVITQFVWFGWLTCYPQWGVLHRVQSPGCHNRDECCWHAFFSTLCMLMTPDLFLVKAVRKYELTSSQVSVYFLALAFTFPPFVWHELIWTLRAAPSSTCHSGRRETFARSFPKKAARNRGIVAYPFLSFPHLVRMIDT
jgi:hypothetical protein